jgi:hypothetical protein
MSSTPSPRRSVAGLRLRMIQASLRKRRIASRRDEDDDDDDDFSTTLTPLLEKERRQSSPQGLYSQVRIQPLSLIDGVPNKPCSSILLSLPITLGRVNLSTWWWNSCSVCCSSGGDSFQAAQPKRKKWKHPAPSVFCSTQCEPVAIQVLALSKAMITISTRGQVEIVGRKPTLVHIQDDESGLRPGQPSSLFKSVFIGEEKRLPWMRFQLELIPQGTAYKEFPESMVSVAKTAKSSGYQREGRAASGKTANQAKKATTNTEQRELQQQQQQRQQRQRQQQQQHGQEEEQRKVQLSSAATSSHHQARLRDRYEPTKLAPLRSSPASVLSPRSSQWITQTTSNRACNTAAPKHSRKRPRVLQFSDEEGGTPKKHHPKALEGSRTQDIHDDRSQSSAKDDGNARNFKSRHDDHQYEETAILLFPGSYHRSDSEGSETKGHGNSQEPFTPPGNGTAGSVRYQGTKLTNDGPPNQDTTLPLPKSSFFLPDQSQSQSSSSSMPRSNGLVCESQPVQRPRETHAIRKRRNKLDGMKDDSDSATSQLASCSTGSSSSILSLGCVEKPPSTQGSINVVGTQQEHREHTQLWQAATSKATSALLDLVREKNKNTDAFWLPILLDDCKDGLSSYHHGFPP